MNRKYKRVLSSIMSVVMLSSSGAAGGINTVHADTSVPTAAYYWDFESVTGTDAGSGATLKVGASVVNDSERGNVLNLPGGNNGQGGYMELPEIFSDVTSEGFTLSMWVKPATNAGAYQRFFEASNSELGATYNGNCEWQLPEFGLVTGGVGDYDVSIYVGAAGTTATNRSRLRHEESLVKDEWRYLTLSVTPNSYKAYLNGIEMTSSLNGSWNETDLSGTLSALFEDNMIQSYQYASIGRSLYSSDGDFEGALDNISVYEKALTRDEVEALAVAEGIEISRVDLLTLYNENKDKSNAQDQYTSESWSVFTEALDEAGLVLEAGTATDQEILEALENLQTAIAGLTYNSVSQYYWDFENVTGTDAGYGAIMKAGASIVDDSERGNVLSLPGGGNGLGGYLELPKIFSDVTSEGFTLSMWVKAATSASNFQRIFEAANSELGATGDGGHSWASPEFGLTPGGNDYDVSIFVGESGMKATNRSRLKYNETLVRGEWQYLTVSVTPDSYKVYINGMEKNYTPVGWDTTDLDGTLIALFEDNFIQTFEYVSLGRGLYGSDGDFEGELDNVSFYKNALTKEEVEALAVSQGLQIGKPNLQVLYNENKDRTNDQNEYTSESWTVYAAALEEAKSVLENDNASSQEILDALNNLQTAVEGLTLNSSSEYYWDFENVTGSNAGYGALLKANAAVVDDSERGKVLNLPGGNNGQGGYMELPEIFNDVTSEGFTLSMWIKPDTESTPYQRFFQASNSTLGATYDGGYGWASPEFGLTPGGGDYDASIYVGEPGAQATYSTRFSHEKSLEKDQWQYFTVSVKPDSYKVYLNGIEQSCSWDETTVGVVLSALFEDDYIQTFRYVSIGRGLYTSDADFKGALDNIKFYKRALTRDEVGALALSEGITIDKTDLQTLYNSNNDKEESKYTTSSWNTFITALNTAKTVLDTADTELSLSQVDDAYTQLQAAAAGLTEKGNKTELQALYDSNKDKVQSKYTEASWKTFATALEEARILLETDNNEVSKKQLDSAVTKLTNAVRGLKESTDKTALQEVYDLSVNITQGNSTQASWNAFLTALEEAGNILNSSLASQEQIDSALDKLQKAVQGLAANVDKSKLQAAYDANKNKNQNTYTKASWSVFATALSEAKAMLQNSGAAQTDIDNALNKLNNASKALITIKVMNKKSVTLGIGEKFQTYVSGSRKDCYFKTSNSSVAKVSSTGVVTAAKKGTATITAVNKNGNAITLKVTVKKAPSKIVKLNAKKKTIKKNAAFKIKVTLPKNTASNKITFKSSNKAVAKVSTKGKVTAKKKGTATITVKTFNGKKKNIKITVK